MSKERQGVVMNSSLPNYFTTEHCHLRPCGYSYLLICGNSRWYLWWEQRPVRVCVSMGSSVTAELRLQEWGERINEQS